MFAPPEGIFVGYSVGLAVGAVVGCLVGIRVGCLVGLSVGASVGAFVGAFVGASVHSVTDNSLTSAMLLHAPTDLKKSQSTFAGAGEKKLKVIQEPENQKKVQFPFSFLLLFYT